MHRCDRQERCKREEWKSSAPCVNSPCKQSGDFFYYIWYTIKSNKIKKDINKPTSTAVLTKNIQNLQKEGQFSNAPFFKRVQVVGKTELSREF